jgi:hypothetical protein
MARLGRTGADNDRKGVAEMQFKANFVALGAGLVAATLGTPASAQAQACNRACLTASLDTYLKAMVAHDPGKANLSASFRQTQNAVAVPLGGGLWKDASAIGALDRRYYDPVTSTAAYFGTLGLQGGERAIVSLRLHVAGGKVDEAEWHIARAGDLGIQGEAKNIWSVDNLLAHPPVARTVPAAQRLGREELIAITNSYFDGISAEDAKVIRAHKGCGRLENGAGAPPGAKDEDGGPADCTSGQGQFGVAFVAGRRYPLVDEEAQVVLGIGVFIRKPGNPKRRNAFTEFFYIDGGKIRDVYAAYYFAPADRAVPNWPPYAGNFPLPASFGEAK